MAFGSQLFLFHRQLGNVTLFPKSPGVLAVLLLSTQTLNFREGEGKVEACVLIHISQRCEHQQEQISKVWEEEGHLYPSFPVAGQCILFPRIVNYRVSGHNTGTCRGAVSIPLHIPSTLGCLRESPWGGRTVIVGGCSLAKPGIMLFR